MANTIADQWRQLPGYAQGAAGGIAAGAIVGLVTQNPIAAVGVGGVLAVYAFVRPTLAGTATRWLTFALFPLLLAVMFGTAHDYTATGLPGNNGGYESYDCGMVVQHPISNPVQSWVNEDATLAEAGTEHVGDTGVTSDCRSTLDSRKVATAVVFGLALIGIVGVVVTEKRERDREQDAEVF